MMDVTAPGDGKFYVAMMTLGGFKYEWNKNGTLSVWSADKDARPINVQTNRGVFVEAVDEAGNVVAEGGDGNWLWVPLSKKPLGLRYKKLPQPDLSPAKLDKARQTVTRHLLSDSPYSLKVPDTVVGMIKWLEKQLAKIPEASRAKAAIDFAHRYEYGESYDNIAITFTEPETDKEVVTRLQVETERARISEAAERAKLAELAAKFPAAGRGKSVESVEG